MSIPYYLRDKNTGLVYINPILDKARKERGKTLKFDEIPFFADWLMANYNAELETDGPYESGFHPLNRLVFKTPEDELLFMLRFS